MFVEVVVPLGTAVVGGGFALAGAYLQGWQNRKSEETRIKAENQRRSADYLLQKEADGLIEILEEAEKCHRLTNKYASASVHGEVSDEFEEEVRQSLNSFESTVRRNSVFLEKEQEEALHNLLGSVRGAELYGTHLQSGNEETAEMVMDWKSFVEDFEEVRSELQLVIRNRINELRENTVDERDGI